MRYAGLRPPLTLLRAARYSARMAGEEMGELATGRIEGRLRRLGIAVIEKRAAVSADGRAHQGINGAFAQSGGLLQVSDQFSAQTPKVVAMAVQGLAR